MAFKEFPMTTEAHNNSDIPGFSPAISYSYFSKFEFPGMKYKNMPSQPYMKSTSNHYIQSVDIMNFVPGFQSSRLSDISKSISPVNNIKKLDSYSQFSDMNMNNLRYLVGGFVGSKSQVGFTSMQGDKFQIWDLVWQKLIEIMGSEDSNVYPKKTEVGLVSNVSGKLEKEKCQEIMKESYADVAKKAPINPANKNKQINARIKENSMKSNKNKKKGPPLADGVYKGRVDFGRSDKKVSLHDMSGFNSSRWSNSRRKHFRKGMEKINKRDKREAARDGLHFVNQEINRNQLTCHHVLVGNNNISCLKNTNDLKAINPSKITISSNNAVDSYNYQIEEETTNCDNGHGSSIINKTSSENPNQGDSFTSSKPLPDDGFRHRLGSVCSVDSEDSFIVFDRSDNEDLISQLCCNDYDLQTIDGGDLSDSSDFSLSSEDDSDCSDVLFVIQPTATCNKSYNDKCSLQALAYNKDENNMKQTFEGSCKLILDVPLKNDVSKFKSKTSVPYAVRCSIMKAMKGLDNHDGMTDETDCEIKKFRSASESSLDSEDSFITFDIIGDVENEDPIHVGKASDIAEECKLKINFFDFYDDSDSDEDFDEINCSILTPHAADYNYDNKSFLEKVNCEWESKFNTEIENNKKKQSKNTKKVHFPPSNKLTTVRKMLTWNYALRAARVGPWELLARDTMRFQNRIHSVSEVLQSVLEHKHREKIWKERFSNVYCND